MKDITNKKGKTVTINDVASLAGVSKTTVSRYLGKKYDAIAEKTRKKIEDAIDVLGYSPSVMAMGLKRNKSRLIGMVIADISNPFSAELIRGAGAICKKNNYSLMLCNTDNDPIEEKEYIFMLQSHRIDGLIINTTGHNNEFLYQLSLDKTPIVLVDRKVKQLGFDTVLVDNKKATKELLNFILYQNYKKIALFTEPVKGVSSRLDRMNTFNKILHTQNSTTGQVYEVDLHSKNQIENSIENFLIWSNGNPKAIFAANSVVMLKVLASIQNRGLNIPQDIGIVGFDNPEWTNIVGNGITTIAQPAYEIGVTAMNRILEHIDGSISEPKIIELPGHIIVRGSTLSYE